MEFLVVDTSTKYLLPQFTFPQPGKNSIYDADVSSNPSAISQKSSASYACALAKNSVSADDINKAKLRFGNLSRPHTH